METKNGFKQINYSVICPTNLNLDKVFSELKGNYKVKICGSEDGETLVIIRENNETSNKNQQIGETA